MTIEVVQTFDLLPDVDPQAYAELAKRTLATLVRAPGLVEIRANRNLLGAPQIRVTTVWERLGNWEAARESRELTELETESRRHMTNVRAEIWGASQLLPEPVRPGARSSFDGGPGAPRV
jgi:hypothetical protein